VSTDDVTWTAITDRPIDVAAVTEWCGTPGSGAIDVFCGTVRDRAEGRTGITRLDYEAHPTRAEPRLARVAEVARQRWPMIERVALIHRVGSLRVGETAVVIAVSTPHRSEAFTATHWCIDAVKATVPIWKYEVWDGGEGWGTCSHELVDLDEWDLRRRDEDAPVVTLGAL
jgi:molybdopterin synthase catalytic subunit